MTGKEGENADGVLSILQKANGQYVSGEYLSKCLGITRSAVWKRIAAIKNEGYSIEASTRKGYRLDPANYPYGAPAIRQGLKTLFMGRELKFYKEIDSTNTTLKRLASEGAPEGTVIVADCQNAGRGRLGRSWASASGKGIWMSVLLRPALRPSDVQTLTLAASVAVCRALESFKIPGVGIKWPNDILIGGKKVCGILAELSAEAERVTWVIIGIGLNVNHMAGDFPPELSTTATSLRLGLDSNKPLDCSSLASEIINRLEEVYESYLKEGSAWVAKEWKRWNLTLGKRVYLTFHNERINALAYDIRPDGRLIVKKDDGTSLEVFSGEVSLRDA